MFLVSTTNIDLNIEDLKNNIEIYFFPTNKKELSKKQENKKMKK